MHEQSVQNHSALTRLALLFHCSLVLVVALLHSSGCSPTTPRGGRTFVVELDRTQLPSAANEIRLLDESAEVLRQRIRKLGARAIIQRTNDVQLIVTLPPVGTNQLPAVRRLLSNSGVVEFRLVRDDTAGAIHREAADYEPIGFTEGMGIGQKSETVHQVKTTPHLRLSGAQIDRAYVQADPIANTPRIHLILNDDGAKMLAEITRRNVGRRLAVLVGGEPCSAPVIRETSSGHQFTISGGFTLAEAFHLAMAIELPLEIPTRVVWESAE